MKKEWNDLIKDESERMVFEALDDPQWDFRTVQGVSKSSGLPENEVLDILNKYPSFVRKSLISGENGRDLYRLSDRKVTAGEVLKAIKTFITKST